MAQLTVQQALHLLELQPGATTEQIRAAYKRLALRYHPDKQQQHSRWPAVSTTTVQQSPRPSITSDSTPHETAASFSLLSAAYQLLTSTASPSQHSDSHHNTISSSVPSFEAAYASGKLFSEQFIDQAVVSGASPAVVLSIQQYATAAANGHLAEALTQQPPTAEDEQLWRQLYKQLTVSWQLQQAQRQQQPMGRPTKPATGGLLAELLSDILLRPVGDQLVEVSDEPSSEGMEEHEAAVGAANVPSVASSSSNPAHSDSAKCHNSCDHQQGQAVHGSAPRQQHQQQQKLTRHQSSSSTSSSSNPRQKQRLRHSLGFYWTWFRRLVVAKAVVSILLGGSARAADDPAWLAQR